MLKHTFRGGIHPLHGSHEGKGKTRGEPIRDFVADQVRIPMDMHQGPPSAPIVKKGDLVKVGQVIGEPQGFRGIPVHASVSGEVIDVGLHQMLGKQASLCVTIQNDGQDTWVDLAGMGSVETAPKDRIIPAIKAAGLCGMGGAGFPTHVKLSLPEGKTADTILVNGAECETFLTSDHRLMLEEAGRIVDGLRAIMRATDIRRGVIAIEDNKPDAIEAMQKAAQGREGVEVAALLTKYPQGGEKQLVQAVLGREVPSGGLPMDAHVIIVNVGTCAAAADAVTEGRPLISRITTVTGAVAKPCNLRVRIGTSFGDAIKAAGGMTATAGKIIAGGTMTGIAAPDETVAIAKTTNGIIVMTEEEVKTQRELACIRCGRCVDACPAYLMPYRLMDLAIRGELEAAEKEHVKDCILCGSCSYVCPSKRWISAALMDAKDQLARRS